MASSEVTAVAYKGQCPRCGGTVIVIGRRAWCVMKHDDNGCGSYWPNIYKIASALQ